MGFNRTTHKVSVYPLTLASGKEKYPESPTVTGLDLGIFPAGIEIQAAYPGISAFQLYEIFCFENVTIGNGDKLISGADEWIIKGVPQKYSDPYASYQRLVGQKVV